MNSSLGLKITVVIVAVICTSCKREERNFRVPPPQAEAAEMVQVDELHAGGPITNSPTPAPISDYKETAYAISQGQQLYEKFNCVGCHAHGGGGMGVALMDDKWIYGSQSQQIFATIVQGRPKGMPSFRGRLTENQVWELAAYVRSLSGLTPRAASPGREDHMGAAPPPNSIEQAKPKNVASPD
jgi:cytochrome c oxidase cbb3-type subunit 3